MMKYFCEKCGVVEKDFKAAPKYCPFCGTLITDIPQQTATDEEPVKS